MKQPSAPGVEQICPQLPDSGQARDKMKAVIVVYLKLESSKVV